MGAVGGGGVNLSDYAQAGCWHSGTITHTN